jgi:hypothetical protein
MCTQELAAPLTIIFKKSMDEAKCQHPGKMLTSPPYLGKETRKNQATIDP